MDITLKTIQSEQPSATALCNALVLLSARWRAWSEERFKAKEAFDEDGFHNDTAARYLLSLAEQLESELWIGQ